VRIPLVADVADVSASSGNSGRSARRGALAPRSFDPPDEQLMQQVGEGSTQALGQLYDRYGRLAYSHARRICADQGLAEDVVQEVFLALWRDPHRFDQSRGRFSSWLLAVAHHKAVDAVRRESSARRHTVPASAADERSVPAGPGADQAALGSVVTGQVRDALGQLPDEQRRAIALAFYGGYTQREVAAITGVPLGTVKSRMYNGVRRLRRVLIPSQWEPTERTGGTR
jgi:RNA polymerase sigma-70 factor (ECF subfamily)